MSARLLGLGFGCDMGTPCRKLVLLKLIDACDDDGSRIFPAVSTIAQAAQCSKRQVQRELANFVGHGLLIVVKSGGRGPHSTREYQLDIAKLRQIEQLGWNEAAAANPPADPVTGEPNKGDTVSPLDDADKGDIGDTKRVTSETDKGDSACHPTPYYPSNDPSPRARDSDSGSEVKKETPEQIERAFRRTFKNWDGYLSDSETEARKAWLELTAEERYLSEKELSRYVSETKRVTGRNYVCAFAKYCREKRWERLEPEVPEAAKPAPVPPLGPAWAAVKHARLIYGPVDCGPPEVTKISRLNAFEAMIGMIGREQAEERYRKLGHEISADGELLFDEGFEARMERQHLLEKGYPAVMALHRAANERQPLNGSSADLGRRLIAAMEPVKAGSPEYQEWEAEYDRRIWPWLPAPGAMPVMYFPRGGPGGLSAFEELVRQQTDKGDDAAEV